ncbi:hypothetical protein OF83DRAFT_697246 [Amylostereum chailletii]|nr:hypothetical protein OF83DRAFT_697246 [Amylostereum chailletii]
MSTSYAICIGPAGPEIPKPGLQKIQEDGGATHDYRPQEPRQTGVFEGDPLDRDENFEQAQYESRELRTNLFWTKYLSINEKYDKELVENWKSNAEGILIFTGLFSATVAAFIVESYKGLKPDSGDISAVLLAQLVAIANGTQPPPMPPVSTPRTILDVNIFWFCSLILSLTCALGATLVQQWTRIYNQAVFDTHTLPHPRGRLRAFLFAGVKRFHLSEVCNTLPVILHLSVFLFFAGIVEFLWPINRAVAAVALSLCLLVLLGYSALTVLPLILIDCPYRTPLSPIVWTAWRPLMTLRRWTHYMFTFNTDVPFLQRVRSLAPNWPKFQGLDEYLQLHRSIQRPLHPSDIEAIDEVSDITFLDSNGESETFAGEVTAVLDTIVDSSYESQLDTAKTIYALSSPRFILLLRLYFVTRDHSHDHVALEQSRRAKVMTAALARLVIPGTTRPDVFGPDGSDQELTVMFPGTNAMIHNLKLIFGNRGKVTTLERLTRHQCRFTAIAARGVLGVLLSTIFMDLCWQVNEAQMMEYSMFTTIADFKRKLCAVFPSAEPMVHLMDTEIGLRANGPVILVACILTEISEADMTYRPDPITIHLPSLALLARPRPFIQALAPEVRELFMNSWKALWRSLPQRSCDPSYTTFIKQYKSVVDLYRSLYDALKKKRALEEGVEVEPDEPEPDLTGPPRIVITHPPQPRRERVLQRAFRR